MTEREAIEEKLATVYTGEGVQMWLRGRHRQLEKQRPLDLIERGEADRVLTIATQLAESAYA
jgi:hypothetical protein